MKIELTTESFEHEVLESEVPVIVDFWADWCVPCKMIAPIMDELATDFSGRLKVTSLDVDAHGEIAAKYDVVSIPTILLFKGGDLVDQHVGAAPKQTIVDFFENHLS